LIGAARSAEVRRLLTQVLCPGKLRLRSMTMGRGDRDKAIVTHGGRRYFLKLTSPAGGQATFAAAELGLAPRVAGMGTLLDGRAVVVQEFIAGTTGEGVRAWMVAHASDLAGFFSALARREDLLATLPAPLPLSPLGRAEIRLRDMRQLEQAIAQSGWDDFHRAQRMIQGVAQLSAALPDAAHALVPRHGDPQIANWIRARDGRLYLVDWDYARLDDPVTDPARLAWWLFGTSSERRAFIAQCGVDVAWPEIWQRAVWSVTAYAGHTALLVAHQGRLERASYFLDLTEQLLDHGL
jgi:hypothetical protein